LVTKTGIPSWAGSRRCPSTPFGRKVHSSGRSGGRVADRVGGGRCGCGVHAGGCGRRVGLVGRGDLRSSVCAPFRLTLRRRQSPREVAGVERPCWPAAVAAAMWSRVYRSVNRASRSSRARLMTSAAAAAAATSLRLPPCWVEAARRTEPTAIAPSPLPISRSTPVPGRLYVAWCAPSPAAACPLRAGRDSGTATRAPRDQRVHVSLQGRSWPTEPCGVFARHAADRARPINPDGILTVAGTSASHMAA
jgi:hypothetical protein